MLINAGRRGNVSAVGERLQMGLLELISPGNLWFFFPGLCVGPGMHTSGGMG